MIAQSVVWADDSFRATILLYHGLTEYRNALSDKATIHIIIHYCPVKK